MSIWPAWFEIERYQEAVAMEESFCDACGENPCECEAEEPCEDCGYDPCECGCICGEEGCDECAERNESNETEEGEL